MARTKLTDLVMDEKLDAQALETVRGGSLNFAFPTDQKLQKVMPTDQLTQKVCDGSVRPGQIGLLLPAV